MFMWNISILKYYFKTSDFMYPNMYPPSKKFLNKISSIHAGYRTVFTWYMCRSIDPSDVEY